MRAVIPPNFDDDGGMIAGLFKKRNLVDVGIFLFIVILLGKILTSIFSHSVLLIAILIVFAIAGGAVLLVGYDDQAITELLYNTLKYKKEKKAVTLGKPTEKNRI